MKLKTYTFVLCPERVQPSTSLLRAPGPDKQSSAVPQLPIVQLPRGNHRLTLHSYNKAVGRHKGLTGENQLWDLRAA